MLQRSRGFDVPDFLAAGPRDVMVAQSGVSAAREMLLQSELISPEKSSPNMQVGPGRALTWLRQHLPSRR
ncbi:MAG TPA: hypothetical protein VGF15_01595 [Solirubrobacteraceae bacterium]|jgi:hypothetical protein